MQTGYSSHGRGSIQIFEWGRMVPLDESAHVRLPSGLLMACSKFIDAHVHANNRSSEDFSRLAAVGCEALVAVAGEEGGFSGYESVLDHFARLALVDRPRIENAGLGCQLALGIHPAGIPARGVDQLLDALEGALHDFGAAAVGEIGLQDGGGEEERVLLAQLEIAARADLPVVLHTPRQGKPKHLARILDLLANSRIAPERVLLDHLNADVLPEARRAGCWLGLSVHPAKLSPAEIGEIVAAEGSEHLVLSTDMGSNPSYLFGIPAAISAMRDRGLAEQAIGQVARDNARAFLGRP